MPATAGTSAGSSTSSMKISGSLDTTNIDRGFARVKSGFESVKGHAKGFYSDLVRMGNEANKFSKNIIRAGMVGSSAIIALASKAPAVAPAMAKMGVAMTKLSINAGEALAPAFEMVVGWLDKFSTWVGNHPDLFAGLVTTLTAMSVLKFTGLGGMLTTLGSAVVSPTVLTALAYIATIATAGTVVANVFEDIAEKIKKFTTEDREQIPGTLESLRSVDKSASEIAAEGYRATPDGMISKGESRRAWFLQLWDSVWG